MNKFLILDNIENHTMKTLKKCIKKDIESAHIKEEIFQGICSGKYNTTKNNHMMFVEYVKFYLFWI